MDKKAVNFENKAIWETNANYWDAYMGANGNDWHQELIAPYTIDLLSLKPGAKLLDIGCGNGLFARKMGSKGIQVTAFDFSENNIGNARKYPAPNIEYRVLDATNYEELVELGTNQFDAAVANMVLMDMPDIDPVFQALFKLLVKGGTFVFSVSHPCFNSGEKTKIEDDSIRIFDYKEPYYSKGEAIRDQPMLQYYFDRPVSDLLNFGFKHGFVVDGFEEPVFQKRQHEVFSKIPPVLIVRMRKL